MGPLPNRIKTDGTQKTIRHVELKGGHLHSKTKVNWSAKEKGHYDIAINFKREKPMDTVVITDANVKPKLHNLAFYLPDDMCHTVKKISLFRQPSATQELCLSLMIGRSTTKSRMGTDESSKKRSGKNDQLTSLRSALVSIFG